MASHVSSDDQTIDQFKGKARLPKFAAPRRYDLAFDIDLTACTFSATAAISVDVVDPTRYLVLNAADLSIHSNSISFNELRPSQVVVVEEDEILVMGFDSDLPVGQGILAITFDGTLNDQMKGLYRSVYEINGEQRNMAVTQFEAADARRCFPCWDEPAFKATFKITLKVPSDQVALSNMPVTSEKVDGSAKIVSFQESPIMSTYLVAIVVGLLDYMEAFLPNGTRVRVYTQSGKINQGKFALDVAVKSLELYTEYFAVPYPLPKMDMVAIPDFAAGAMENYGLVTYRETALLYDDKNSSASIKQDVAITVTHELAHQWFGNLVTMEWWTHLWLNEGFATWMSYLATDSLFPEWKVWNQFLDDETTSGLTLDALSESHPIEVEIGHANEIDAIFDDISYSKGASVIHMLHSYLGAPSFQKSLASYIKRFAYSNAKTEDLWAVLGEGSGEPVKDLMESWTKQKGYPVVSVEVKGQELVLSQAQFLSDGTSGDLEWIVPLTLCSGSYNNVKKFLLKTKYEKLAIEEHFGSPHSRANILSYPGKSQNGWIKLNVNQTGFYRVKYDDSLASGLKSAIESNLLNSLDRFGILDDSYALCVACMQTLSHLLQLLAAYKKETEYNVLSRIIFVSGKVVNLIADAAPTLTDNTKLFFINLLNSATEKLGWDPINGENDLDAILRGQLLTLLASFSDEGTINEAVKRFNIFLCDRKTSLLPADIRKAAYIAVMQTVSTSDRAAYDSLLKIYRESNESEERVRILGSLASCPDPDIVLEALNFLLTYEVRNQDAIYGLRAISRQGRETAWSWLKENWDYISKTWVSSNLISRIISYIVSPFCTEEKAVEIEEFFASRVKPSFARALKQSLEQVRIKARWVDSVRKEKSLADVIKDLTGKEILIG